MNQKFTGKDKERGYIYRGSPWNGPANAIGHKPEKHHSMPKGYQTFKTKSGETMQSGCFSASKGI
jgi:hypothetical protein